MVHALPALKVGRMRTSPPLETSVRSASLLVTDFDNLARALLGARSRLRDLCIFQYYVSCLVCHRGSCCLVGHSQSAHAVCFPCYTRAVLMNYTGRIHTASRNVGDECLLLVLGRQQAPVTRYC